MNIKFLKYVLVFVSLSVCGIAKAGLITFQIDYIGSNAAYEYNLTSTYTGDGYVSTFQNAFLNSLSIDNARSYFQVDISGLHNKTITSATLDFFIGGTATDTGVLVTSFNSNGILGHFWDAPNVLSSGVFTVVGGASNSLNVMSLLNERVSSDANYFALHFNGNTSDIYTQPSNGASLFLNVNYTDVPEPSTLAIFALGIMGLASRRFKKQS
jgi:hypothetical protein